MALLVTLENGEKEKMANSNNLTTIVIDKERSALHFYSMLGKGKSAVTHHIKSYSGGALDESFFVKFKEAVKEFAENVPSERVRRVTVVLPDNAVLTDTVKVPTMKTPSQTKRALDVTLDGLYRNCKDLKITAQLAAQNKQYTTFTVMAVQKYIASSIYAACSESKLLVDTLTSASGATVGGAVFLNPKLKNASYLLLDIKDVYSKFVFVSSGRPVGNYTLPFGLEFLKKPTVVQEDMLFDHSYAELAVINAREKAKSKKLTVMALDELPEELDAESEEYSNTALDGESFENSSDEGGQTVKEDVSAAPQQPNQKIFTRKAPRKLPKFMQRDIPETKEGIAFENFRIFVKWALSLISGNEKLTELSQIETVYVNIPRELAFVLDKTNEEAEQNGIVFTLFQSGQKDASLSFNLDLYGGMYPKNINSLGKL